MRALQSQLCDRLASVANEFNAVVGAASSESKPPATASQLSLPPGRLAARRIAYELSLRGEREKARKEKYLSDIQIAPIDDTAVWRQKVTASLPADLVVTPAANLKVSLVVLQNYLAFSPDHEHQIWLLGEMEKIREALARAQAAWTADPESS